MSKVLFKAVLLTASLPATRPVRHGFNSGDGLNNSPVSCDGCFSHNGLINLKNTNVSNNYLLKL